MRWSVQPIPCLQCNGQIILMHSALSILPAVVDGWMDNCQITNTSVFPRGRRRTIGHQCRCSSTVTSKRRGCSSDSVCLRLSVLSLGRSSWKILKEPNVSSITHVAGLTGCHFSGLCPFLCLLACLLSSVQFSSILSVHVR